MLFSFSLKSLLGNEGVSGLIIISAVFFDAVVGTTTGIFLAANDLLITIGKGKLVVFFFVTAVAVILDGHLIK